MEFVQSAYLQPDLWARYNLDKAEEFIQGSEKENRLRIKSRFQYGVAAIKSASQATMHLAPTVIFLVGHIVASTVNLVYTNKASNWISAKHHSFSSCFTGAVVTTLVSLFSATLSTKIGRKIHAFSARKNAENWEDFTKRIQQEFIQNIETARRKRIDQTVQGERFLTGSVIYRTSVGGIQRPTELFYDVLTEKRLGHVQGHIERVKQRLQTSSDAEKQQIVEEAKRKIADYVNKQTQQLGKLPMNFLEVGDYQLRKAEKLKAKAACFSQEEAQRVAMRYQMQYPTLFDGAVFGNKVQGFQQAMNTDLSSYVAAVRARQASLQTVWNQSIGAAQNQEKALHQAINSQQRWLRYFGWSMRKEARDTAEEELNEKRTQLGQIRNARNAIAYRIKGGAFSRVLDARQSFDRRFCKYVSKNGWILKSTEKFAKPWFFRRWAQNLTPTSAPWSGWFDPAAT